MRGHALAQGCSAAGIIPEARQPKQFTLAAIQLMKNMPYLLLGAQFAAIYLMGAVPKK